MNILFLTNTLPFQRRNGGEVCSFRLIARLCRISDRILVVGRGDTMGLPQISQLEVCSLEQPATEFAKMSVVQKLLSLANALVSGDAWTVQRMSDGVIETLRKTVAEEDFDCIFIDHLQIFKWYRSFARKRPAVLVAHNVEHQVYGDLLQRSRNLFSRWVLKREQRLLYELDKMILKDVGVVACLTEADKLYYTDLARLINVDATIEIIPSYFESSLGGEHAPNNVESGSDRPYRIGILGTWTWQSNRLGLEWFLEQVLPHVDNKCDVIVAGRGLQSDQLPDRVRYLGFVESAEQFYRSSDVIAIPSIAGGGVQEKIIEAIGYGIPVVATDFAVRGIQPCPSHVRIACTPTDFAAACCRQQDIDPVQARSEAAAWNLLRRSDYDLAIDRLLLRAKNRIQL